MINSSLTDCVWLIKWNQRQILKFILYRRLRLAWIIKLDYMDNLYRYHTNIRMVQFPTNPSFSF